MSEKKPVDLNGRLYTQSTMGNFYCIDCFPEGCTCGKAYRRWAKDEVVYLMLRLTEVLEEKSKEVAETKPDPSDNDPQAA